MGRELPRTYSSFNEFEKAELRQVDYLSFLADDSYDEGSASGPEEDSYLPEDDGILFDRIED